MSLVRAENLTKTYRAGDIDVPAIKGVDFAIEPASFVAFVGPSGSGKSTLLTPSLTLIANLDDRSFSLTPELLYTGITNLDLRLRAAWLQGSAGSEFGEKQNARRLELMLRWYF